MPEGSSSVWKRLRKFAALPTAEQGLALRAIEILAVVRVLLWLVPFGRVRAVVDCWSGAGRSPEDQAFARGVRRAVDRAARSIPGSACLAQALTAEVMLRRAGQSVRVSIGVAPGGQPLDAHAWVESGGIVVTGDSPDPGGYAELLTFATSALQQLEPGFPTKTNGQ